MPKAYTSSARRWFAAAGTIANVDPFVDVTGIHLPRVRYEGPADRCCLRMNVVPRGSEGITSESNSVSDSRPTCHHAAACQLRLFVFIYPPSA